MIKEISPSAMMFGILAVLAMVSIGFVGLNTVIYAVMDNEPVKEAVAVEVESPLITKNDL